jgi:aryl-alcohol dehydrogenase
MSRPVRAAVVEEPGGPFLVDDLEIDDPRGDEILVRITAVGVCHTDLSTRAVWPAERLPMVFGHEGTGVVEAVGDRVTRIAAGDTVVLTFRSCGTCEQCVSGAPAYCQTPGLNSSGGRSDGSSALSRSGRPVRAGFFGQSSFASYAISYESNTVRIPAGLAPSVAAPLGCGVQTGAGAVLNVLRPRGGDSLAVFGGGGVGLSAVIAAAAVGCRTVVVDPVASRRRLALELGAVGVVDPTADDAVTAVRDLTGGGARHVVDTTGRPDVLASALDALTHRGQLAVLGIGAPVTLDTMSLMSKGVTVRGVIEGDSVPHAFIPRLVDLHDRGLLPVERLVTEFPFDKIEDAVAAAHSGEVVKPVLVLEP